MHFLAVVRVGLRWHFAYSLLVDENQVSRFDSWSTGSLSNLELRQALLGEELPVYGTGHQTRCFVHVSDTVPCGADAAARRSGYEPGLQHRLRAQGVSPAREC